MTIHKIKSDVNAKEEPVIEWSLSTSNVGDIYLLANGVKILYIDEEGVLHTWHKAVEGGGDVEGLTYENGCIVCK